MLNRLNTEKSLAPYVVQFVPLKVDTASTEYAALQRKHRSEGNTIPKIFLIRADGEKLYAKSGSLPGEQLPSLMVAALKQMGRPLGLSEAKLLEGINKQIKDALGQNNYRTVAEQFNKLKKLGSFGQIDSYAAAAIENNQLATEFKDKITKLSEQYSSELDSQNAMLSSINAISLKNDVSLLAPFRVQMNELEKKVRTSLDSPQELNEIKNVASAIKKLDHKSENLRVRAATTLAQFAAKTNDESTREYLEKLVSDSGVPPEPTTTENAMRVWRSNDGKYSIEAQFVAVDGTQVKLKKPSGEMISVAIDRLSKADQTFLRQKK